MKCARDLEQSIQDRPQALVSPGTTKNLDPTIRQDTCNQPLLPPIPFDSLMRPTPRLALPLSTNPSFAMLAQL